MSASYARCPWTWCVSSCCASECGRPQWTAAIPLAVHSVLLASRDLLSERCLQQSSHIEQVLLEHIGARTSPRGGFTQVGSVMVGDDDDPCCRIRLRNLAGRRNTVCRSQVDVHQHEVRSMCEVCRQRVFTVCALVDLVCQVRDDAGHHSVEREIVINDQEPHGDLGRLASV